MYDSATRIRATVLARSGLTLSETSRATGISRSTLRTWLRHGSGPPPNAADCPLGAVNAAPYAYLLGLYLGDGCISPSRRGVFALRIACGNVWPGLIDACEQAMTEVLPTNRVCRVACPGCTSVVSYSKHWPCLFPQAGPGPKHLRPIVLAAWQRAIVTEHPWELTRGLIHSDGCRFMNRATRGERHYAYPRYVFTNKSDDIRRILTDALDQVGVEWKVTKRGSSPYNISIARRASVALMDEHVGPKY